MKKALKIIGFFSVVIFSAVFLSACQPTKTNTDTNSVGSTGSSSGGSTQTTGTPVEIKNMKFSPSTLNIKAGDTVTWTNNDTFSHTVTGDKSEFNSARIQSGKTFSFTFTKEGTYTYHCEIHAGMRGTIVVAAK